MAESDIFNQEAEEAVLCILLQNPLYAYNSTDLKSNMFSSSVNKILFESIHRLAEDNLVPELNLLENYLNSKSSLNSVGGKEYLHYLINKQVSKENLKEFERMVINNYKARTIISTVTEIPNKVIKTADVDSVIRSLRDLIDGFDETIKEDVSVFRDILKFTWDGIVERSKNPGIRGYPTGFSTLDLILGGYNEGDLLIVGGRPGSGKTAWLCNSCLDLGKNNIPSLFFEQEMGKDQLIERMLALETGIPITDIRLGKLTDKELDTIIGTVKSFKDLPIFIDTKTREIEDIISTIRKYHKSSGVKVVFIDYVQLLADRNQFQTQEIGHISLRLKTIARELNITVVLVSQLNRAVELREDKRPILSDLRQSGDLEQDADIVLMLYRDEYYNPNTKDKGIIEFLLRKNRNGDIGTLVYKINLPSNKIFI